MRNIKFKKTLKLLIIILFISQFTKASEKKWEITGRVVEDNTELSIPYVSVSVNNKSDYSLVTGTITNDSGEFIIENISNGDYYITFSFLGYKDYTIDSIDFNEQSMLIDLGKINLEWDTEALTEIEVTAKIDPIRKSIDKQVINVEKNINSIGGQQQMP